MYRRVELPIGSLDEQECRTSHHVVAGIIYSAFTLFLAGKN